MKRLLPALLLFIFNGVAAASPAMPEVVRYDRYLLVSTSPQQPPLEQLTALSVPPGFHPTVGEALQYLLRDSGWSLCLADARRAQLYGLPLPLSQYHTGPLRLKASLQLLAGPAWRITTDENRREVCFASDHSLPPTVAYRHPVSHRPLGPLTAPFFLAGTVQRGDIHQAVIVPPEAVYLHQVVWLRRGEQWQGWRLELFDERRAVFRHGKRQLTLKVPE
ncbi:TPA: pilus assembly protein PilL [Salmonella enterica]|uniref:Pilus assembly protein PilL n=2 Tax=Salmonella enterica TaxID=28901 RepID=A0A758BEM8_SALER|nr:pilus assembly protein PilL [Salmonella enterica subsp. enterica serovar Koketime]EAM8930565.1 pilus assembly protein PilL [Salmonella enterica]EBB4437953.1 pilus assembly protein PilL [Salmonella enterica]EBR9057161.1 pilus assembly protein PilL [Salmonella enterica subsp. enterica serovar Koketime]EBR9060209.1 pilus assembly protein PilL [Salmonella enterica subsp. enterica serovar Koketime]